LLFKASPILARLYAARCGSAIFGALSCVFGYLLAYELRQTRQWGWALGFCMALLPMYVFMTAVVNNDAALNLAGAALIWLAVRIYRRDVFSVPLALGLGVTSGLALLTKQTIAPVVIVGGIVVLIKIIPSLRSAWQETRTRLIALAAYGGSFVAVYGPWLFFRFHYFGDFGLGAILLSPIVRFFTGGTPVAAASSPSVESLSGSLSSSTSLAVISLWHYVEITKARGWAYFQDLLVTNFWGNFGWLDAPMPDRVFIPIVVVYIIGCVGVLIQLGLQRKRRGELFLLLAFLIAQALFLFIGLDYFEGYVRSGAAIGLQGRYFFPILAPLLFLLLSGWDHLCKENGLVLRLAPLGMACLQLIGMATICARYYGVAIG
jgi:4-amino-4-deoxy-L-arabinose transferase-like glycosyltransferase